MCVVGRPTRGRRACLFVSGSGRPPPRPYWGRSARPVRPGRPVPLDLTHGPPRPVRPVPSRLSGLLGPSHAPRGPSLPLSGRPYGPLSGISPALKTPLKATMGRLSYVRPVSAPSRLSRLSPRAAYIPALGRLRAVFGEYRVFINLSLPLLCGFVSRDYFTRVSPHRGL